MGKNKYQQIIIRYQQKYQQKKFLVYNIYPVCLCFEMVKGFIQRKQECELENRHGKWK